MNKNHLLPAMLFVLAACGGTASSSVASSTPASTSAPSSAPVDPNEYRLIGSQANLGTWTPVDAPVMTRATGTNSFAITIDIYEESEFKVVIGTDWANGEVGPLSSGITISVDGVAWTKDMAGAPVIPEASKIEASGTLGTGNFKARDHGSYTVTFVSLPVLTRTFSIVRNGDPIVPPPVVEIETDPANWFIVGNVTDPNWTPTDKSKSLTPVVGVAGAYSIDLDLVLGNQFKVKTGDAFNTGRDLGFAAVTSVTTNLFTNDGGNINSLVSGRFRLTYTFAPSAGTITIAPLGWIGYATVVTQGATSTSIAYINPSPADYGRNSQLRLTAPFDQTQEGIEFDFTGKAGDEYLFKVEGGGNAAELMATATGAAQTFIVPVKQLTQAQRATLNLFVVFARTSGSTGTIVLRDWKYVAIVTPAAPTWRAEGGATATMNGDAMTFTYTARGEFYFQNAQINLLSFDGSKDSVTVPFTGVATQEYMFKFEYPGQTNNVEYPVTATGVAQTLVIDLTKDKNGADLTPSIRSTFNKFVVFSLVAANAGSITVNPWYYTPVWMAQGDGATVSVNQGAMTFTYTARGNFWDQYAKLPVIGYDSSKTSLTVAFTGVASQEYMFKVEFVGGNREFRVIATGSAQTTTLDLSALTPEQRSSINLFVVFSFVNTNAGSITVTSFTYTAIETPAAPEWRAEGGATATMNGDAMTFTYTTRGDFWAQNAQINLLSFDGSKDSVTVPFTGVATQEYMFKFEYPGHTNNVEFRVIATGVAQTAVLNLAPFSAEIRATFNKFVVFSFIAANAGSITVNPWYYTPVFVGVGTTVTVTNNNMTMAYTTSNEWWNTHAKIAMVNFDGTKSTVSITFTGVVGHRYLFKFERPSDRANMEYGFDATGAEQTVTINLTLDKNNNPISQEARNDIDLFVVFCATGGVTGSVTVKPLVIS